MFLTAASNVQRISIDVFSEQQNSENYFSLDLKLRTVEQDCGLKKFLTI